LLITKRLIELERVACKARDSIKSRNSATWLLVEKGAFCFWAKNGYFSIWATMVLFPLWVTVVEFLI
jgi:hypothetical protein